MTGPSQAKPPFTWEAVEVLGATTFPITEASTGEVVGVLVDCDPDFADAVTRLLNVAQRADSGNVGFGRGSKAVPAETPALETLRAAQFPALQLEDVLEAVSPAGGALFGCSPEGGLSDEAVEHTSFDCWPGQSDSEYGYEHDDDKRTALGLAFGQSLLREWAAKHELPRLAVIATWYEAFGQVGAMRLAAIEFVRAGFAVYDGEQFFEVYRLDEAVHAEVRAWAAAHGAPAFFRLTCDCGAAVEPATWICVEEPEDGWTWQYACIQCGAAWTVEQQPRLPAP